MNVINFERNMPAFEENKLSPILARVVARPMVGKGKEGRELPTNGIVGNYAGRDGKPHFLGVTSESFGLVQMRDLTDQAEKAMCRHFDMKTLDSVKIRDTSANNGAFVERRYTIGDVTRDIDYIGGGYEVGTTVGKEFRVRTGYDGQTSTSLSTGAIDLRCLNGMVSFKNIDAFSRRHTKRSTLDVFVAWIETGLEGFDDQVEHLRMLARPPVDFDQAKAVVHKLPGISETRAKAIFDRVETEMLARGQNAYAVLSALTFYSSHNKDQFKVRRTGNDNVATTLAERELEVNRWARSDAFCSLYASAA